MKMVHEIVLAPVLALISCGGGVNPDLSTSDGNGTPESDAADAVVTPGDDAEEPSAVSIEPKVVQAGAVAIHAQAYRPAECTKAAPCPAVVLVPDKDSAGIQEFECCGAKLAQKIGSVVITYNPPGRGVTGAKTGGEEDFGGPAAQDALKDLANAYAKSSYIDATSFGIVALGTGLSDAAGAVARFQATALDFVGYLIDIEGPTNRCFITQSPFHVDDEGWYINADGPGVSTTRCDFDLYDRGTKFPAGTSSDGKGNDGTPNSYICHQNAYPIRLGGKPCDDDAWWGSREPKTYLKDIAVNYLRIQFLHDHEQPTRHNAREALRWVTQSEAVYQINNVGAGNNLQGYTEEDLVKSGVYLKYDGVGNGFGTGIYDLDGDFDGMSKADMLTAVLPKFIQKMQKKVGRE